MRRSSSILEHFGENRQFFCRWEKEEGAATREGMRAAAKTQRILLKTTRNARHVHQHRRLRPTCISGADPDSNEGLYMVFQLNPVPSKCQQQSRQELSDRWLPV